MPIEIITGLTSAEVRGKYNEWEKDVMAVRRSRQVLMPNGQMGYEPLTCGSYQMINITEDFTDRSNKETEPDYDFRVSIALMFFHNHDSARYDDNLSIQK